MAFKVPRSPVKAGMRLPQNHIVSTTTGNSRSTSAVDLDDMANVVVAMSPKFAIVDIGRKSSSKELSSLSKDAHELDKNKEPLNDWSTTSQANLVQ